MKMALSFISLPALIILLAGFGCNGKSSYICEPGETQECFCPSGENGAQVCREDRTGWEDCECEEPSDAGTDGEEIDIADMPEDEVVELHDPMDEDLVEEDSSMEPLDDEPGEEPPMDAELDEIEEEAAEDVAGEDVVEEDPYAEDFIEEDGGGEDAAEEDMAEEEGPFCGNGIKEGEEVCDGDDLGGETCIIRGFGAGILGCLGDCTDFDLSGCSADCTDHPDFTPCIVETDPDRDYDICIGGECLSPGCGDATCNPPGPHFPLPDTNQRACYDETYEIVCPSPPGDSDCAITYWCGQDAQYGWDTEHEESERFAVAEPGPDGEPVVTDNVTGLDWQGCSAGQSGSDCSTGSPSTYSWQDALVYCDGLAWGGHDDWRLPDRYEFQSIEDYGSPDPSIDTAAFPQTLSPHFWSSSSYAGSSSDAWLVYFNGGAVHNSTKDRVFAVRCVRLGSIGEEGRFTVETESEPVVTDNVTGLEWQGCPAGQSGSDCSTGSYTMRSRRDAMRLCEGLEWAGYEDWYLPDIKELTSIVDDHTVDPSINTSAFPGTPSVCFYSSSSYAGAPLSTWSVHFGSGCVNGFYTSGSGTAVRCVRRGP